MKKSKIALNVCFALLALTAAFFVGIRLLGFHPYKITTNSMSPEINRNDTVFAKSVNFDSLDVGDVIVYIQSANLNTVCHQIIDVDKIGRQVRTKGIANEYADVRWIDEENIVGKVYFKIPHIGN